MSAQELRQDIRTSLKLTASLTQSIKTLQLSSHELEEYISTQILENPFLADLSISGEIDDFKIKKELYDKKPTIKTFDSFYSSVDHLESEVSLSQHLLQQVSYVIMIRTK